MTHTDAEQLLGLLVGGTTGWGQASDETIVLYTRALCAFRDDTAAYDAVHQIIDTWSEARRPPIAAINAAYTDVMRRQQMTRPALPTAGGVVSLDEGRRIAARAYAAECERRPDDDPLIRRRFRSREPRASVLNAFLGLVDDA